MWTNESQQKVLIQALEKFGAPAQINMVIEECAELIQAIRKHDRKPSDATRNNLLEEMADVLICVEQLVYISYAYEDIPKIMARKINRLSKRMEKGEY